MSISQLFNPNSYDLYCNSINQNLQQATLATNTNILVPNTGSYELVFRTPIMVRSKQDLSIEVSFLSGCRQTDAANIPVWTIYRHITDDQGADISFEDMSLVNPGGLGTIEDSTGVSFSIVDFEAPLHPSYGVYYALMSKNVSGTNAGHFNVSTGRVFFNARELAN